MARSSPVVPSPPDVVNLVRQTDALDAIALARIERGLSWDDLCASASLSRNSVAVWRRGRRSPILSKFEPLARALGYSVELEDHKGQVVSLGDLPACIERINIDRRLMGVGLYEMEYRSGVSFRSFFAWRNGERSPTLANIVAVAETFGFSVVMRRMA